jgi:hypothetical protein
MIGRILKEMRDLNSKQQKREMKEVFDPEN